jgi:hypothetical protein
MPVDVFHARNKHHETDTFCQTHCNPAMFRELVGDNNEWVFNSSAAEQANVWFGGFQSIVREMPVAKYVTPVSFSLPANWGSLEMQV